mmetsp:Transcript_15469/g.18812  ORF Transcript_15469/g.18812 Transcript_15469/m.18812 type:complete len:243 (-) Transcript_15469:890-1618(-)
MVLPLDAVRISDGTIARSFIMFSQAGTMKFASTPSGCICPIAHAAPRTAADPPQSNFIRCIPAVFTLYPPVSKSRPFPTIPTFLLILPFFGGLYVKWMNCGSVSLPRATPRYAPIPRFSHSFLSSMVALMQPLGLSSAICRARLAKLTEFKTLCGLLTISFATKTPLVIVMPCSIASAKSLCELSEEDALASSKLILTDSNFSAKCFFLSSERYRLSEYKLLCIPQVRWLTCPLVRVKGSWM